MDNKKNPVFSVPPLLAILIGGIGFYIGISQPLWVAVVYVIGIVVVGFVIGSVITRFKK